MSMQECMETKIYKTLGNSSQPIEITEANDPGRAYGNNTGGKLSN